MIDFHPLLSAFQTARRELLALRAAEGHWIGEVSSSPFATASAAGALCIVAANVTEDARRDAYRQLASRSAEWLASAQASDGGWGDIAVARPTWLPQLPPVRPFTSQASLNALPTPFRRPSAISMVAAACQKCGGYTAPIQPCWRQCSECRR